MCMYASVYTHTGVVTQSQEQNIYGQISEPHSHFRQNASCFYPKGGIELLLLDVAWIENKLFIQKIKFETSDLIKRPCSILGWVNWELRWRSCPSITEKGEQTGSWNSLTPTSSPMALPIRSLTPSPLSGFGTALPPQPSGTRWPNTWMSGLMEKSYRSSCLTQCKSELFYLQKTWLPRCAGKLVLFGYTYLCGNLNTAKLTSFRVLQLISTGYSLFTYIIVWKLLADTQQQALRLENLWSKNNLIQ